MCGKGECRSLSTQSSLSRETSVQVLQFSVKMSRAGRGCPFLLLMRIFVNLVVSVTSTGIKTFASVRFDPPYIHDLIAGTNSTVTMAVDLDTRHQEFAKLSPEKPFTVILKLEFLSIRNDLSAVYVFEN